MSFSYTTPTGLTGVPASLSIPLTWNPSALISGGPSLLLHMDGVNGSTTFTDSSGYANSMTNINAVISTTTKAFGPSSGNFNGSAAVYVPALSGGIFDLGSTGAPWTIEGWMYVPSGTAAGNIIFGLSNLALGQEPIQLFVGISGPNYILSGTVAGAGVSSPGNIAPNTWTHFALVGDGALTVCYTNGVGGTVVTYAAFNIAAGGFNFTVGAQGVSGGIPSAGYVGYIDEFMVTRGVARYTTNFTPPAAPFPGVTPTGYDVYRNGISIAQYVGAPGYTDNVPGVGLYTYNVAGSDGMTTDLSGLSAPFTIGIGQIGGLQAKFVPALDFKAIMVANPGSINPRIYPPLDDNTVRVKP